MPSDRSCLHQLDSWLTSMTTTAFPSTYYTDLRPDIVWWNDNSKKVRMVELTVPFENDAAERKETSYEDMVHRAKQAGYTTPTSGGSHTWHCFCRLKQERFTRTELSSLLSHVPHKAIEGSFSIWCSRNRVLRAIITVCLCISIVCVQCDIKHF